MNHLVECDNYEKDGDHVVLRCEETGDLFLLTGKALAAIKEPGRRVRITVEVLPTAPARIAELEGRPPSKEER